MVSLSTIQSSNYFISSTLPPGLVAVFVGATSGIGETTLKQFARHARKPRANFLGRSQDAGHRIAAECKALNPDGEYIFIKADVSLIRVVDQVCEKIREKEKAVNLLFLSASAADISRTDIMFPTTSPVIYIEINNYIKRPVLITPDIETSEHLHLIVALGYYSRIRFATNLLPVLRNATSLRHVVVVAAGGHEGQLDTSDFQARRIPLLRIRGHLTTMISLGFEAVAKTAPDVSFVSRLPWGGEYGAVCTRAGYRGRGYEHVFRTVRALDMCTH